MGSSKISENRKDWSRKDWSRKDWKKPELTRYRPKKGDVQEYQVASGVTNSFKCTNPDQCSGAEGAAALPPWLVP